MLASAHSGLSAEQMRMLSGQLFRYSQSRGGEASGIACFSDESIAILKEPSPAREFIRTPQYVEMLDRYLSRQAGGTMGLIGHSRLVTNGFEALSFNNQPTIKDGVVCVHNGIVVNDSAIWSKYPGMTRKYEVDTEVIVSLFRHFVSTGLSLFAVVNRIFGELEGAMNIALIADDVDSLVLATNNGSLYFTASADGQALMFASEEEILKKSVASSGAGRVFDGRVVRLEPGEAMTVHLTSLETETWMMGGEREEKSAAPDVVVSRKVYFDDTDEILRTNLRRCSRCILPETMPFIEFGPDGECNYCKNFTPAKQKSLDELLSLLSPSARASGRPDCIVGFSGGRDSSYGLHYLKKELGLNPLAYTYDWGMITDLARRNQSRICGKLGIEQILHSADIARKREYVRKNVMAWLKNPDLGTIPIFMAGDKHFYYYINRLQKQLDVPIIFCENGKLERSHFKAGFAGVNEMYRRAYDVSRLESLRLAFYYVQAFLRNPAYVNRSLIDTATGYCATYFLDHSRYHYLYEHMDWNEEEIDRVLVGEYGWETDPTTPSTWRIGDGTAAFYNYIYYTLAGLTENDTLRSNQIRYGMMSREEALHKVVEENQPRYEAMQWYANTIGFNLTEAIKRINAAPKAYGPRQA